MEKKRIIFREFLEIVEDEFVYKTVDKMLNEKDPESEGIYTSVGTCHHKELYNPVITTSNKTRIEIPELYKQFGTHVFTFFIKKYPGIFKDIHNDFTFLSNINETIHVEEVKLYPDAESPTLITELKEKNKTIVESKSARKSAGLAGNVIMGCFNHFKEDVTISKNYFTEDTSRVKFT